ncbi:MAG: uroporphyrinogen decarboxylase family protein [Candidatus Latescibacterota bacterium]
MTPKERIDCVLQGRAPDRVPLGHISISSRIASHLLGRQAHVGGGINRWREATALWNGADAHAEFVARAHQDAVDIALALDCDLVRSGYWRDGRRPAARIDAYTFRFAWDQGRQWEVLQLDPVTECYNRVDGSAQAERTLEDLESEVERQEEAAAAYAPGPDDFADVRYALERVGHERHVRCAGMVTSIPVDQPAWLEAALLRPELVGRLLDAQVVRSLKSLRVLAGMGGQLIFGGGDFASSHGPMYSPRLFAELVLPRLQRLSAECSRLGVYHFFGSDGNLWPVAEDLYGRSGIHGHYEVDRRAGMDALEIHRRYPHLVMVGDISSFTLHVGSVNEVVEETRACLRAAQQTHRVISGCSNLIMPETPLGNVDAMLETIARHR